VDGRDAHAQIEGGYLAGFHLDLAPVIGEGVQVRQDFIGARGNLGEFECAFRVRPAGTAELNQQYRGVGNRFQAGFQNYFAAERSRLLSGGQRTPEQGDCAEDSDSHGATFILTRSAAGRLQPSKTELERAGARPFPEASPSLGILTFISGFDMVSIKSDIF